MRMRLTGPIGRSERGRGWQGSRRLGRGRTSSSQGMSPLNLTRLASCVCRTLSLMTAVSLSLFCCRAAEPMLAVVNPEYLASVEADKVGGTKP